MKSSSKARRAVLVYLILIFSLLLSTCGPGNNNEGDDSTNGPENGGSESVPEPELEIPETPDGALIVSIPAGEFLMGSSVEDDGNHGDELPQHPVDMAEFLIYATEVTNQMYAQCVEAGECTLPAIQDVGPTSFYENPDYGEYPVVGVSWYQATRYCEWVGGRLPTEQEWEKAARGTEGWQYPWGNDPATTALTNMIGATSPPSTMAVGSFPDGASPYGIMDMAGNVYEWVYDWYSPESYYPTAAILTAGVPFGTERAVRGGSYLDGPETHRAAARFSFPPGEQSDFIGFRCSISGQEPVIAFAPFCPEIYTSFCSPGGDLPTFDPRQPTQPDPNIRIAGFPCPQGGTADISIDLGLPSAEGFTVHVNGLPFRNCYELSEYPGRLYCSGPAPPPGYSVEVTICRERGATTGPTSVIGSSSLLASLDPSAYYIQPLQTEPDDAGGPDTTCPPGYTFDPNTGACIWEETGDNCPDGWVFNYEINRCEPPEDDDCPPGTTSMTVNFGSTSVETCVPDEGEDCPEGYFFNRLTQSCEPETNESGFCPEGYYFNRAINCCAPIPGDNFGCPEGTYYQPPAATLTNLTPGIAVAEGDRCIPISQEGCPPGYHYDRILGCVPDDSTDVPPGTPLTHLPGNDDGCPPGTHLGPDGRTCIPDDPTTGDPNAPVDRGDCPPGTVLTDMGTCEPVEGGEDCGPGAYYDARLDRCIVLEEGEDCGPGYTLTHLTPGCSPSDGPGSTCPPGYAYHPVLNCCVPLPGMDGTDCPGDEQGVGLPSLTYYNPNPTNFDPVSGDCPGDEESDCPPGYVLDPATGACVPIDEDDCPPGTTAVTTNFAAASITHCVPDEGEDCPDGYTYNPFTGSCEPEEVTDEPDCDEGMYFDAALGYCVPLNPDGCEQGYTLDENGRCVPIPQTYPPVATGAGMICPLGYYYDPNLQLCVRGEGGQDCWTILFTVPECFTPTPPQCPPGQRWDEETQTCVDRDDGPGPPCSSYGNETDCRNAGCTWHRPATRAPYCGP